MRFVNRTSKGQASFVLVLVLGFVSILTVLASGSLSVSNVQIEDVVQSSNKAWFAAWAGVDELMYRLRSGQEFSPNYEKTLTLANGATVSATITGNFQKIVRSSGFVDGVIKRLEVTVASSSSRSNFGFAVQAGEGGFELLNNSYVTGINNTDGNVYSNGDIRGISSSSGGSGSRILGHAWAVGYIGGLYSPASGGVYVKKNAGASRMLACRIGGNATAPIPPSNCPVSGTFTLGPGPQTAPLVDLDALFWKNLAESGGVWEGNCLITEGSANDCTSGSKHLGKIKINGDLNIYNNQTVTITGPIWVKGDVNISNNVIINVDNSVGQTSVMVIASDSDNPLAKGRIVVENNVDFNRNSLGAGIILLSENTSDVCTNPAIEVENNTDTAIFAAVNGCVFIGNNAVVVGVVGKKIHLENNSIIRNDPTLFSKLVLVGGGGWDVVNIREY